MSAPLPGCLIDGHHGWHGHYMMVDLAIDLGFPIRDEDRAHLDRYRSDMMDHESAEWVTGQGGLMDEAEGWLNTHVAENGHHFAWEDGEFFYQELEDDETC